MTTITDHFIEQRIREAITRADWHWNEFQIGVYVRLRIYPYPIGRIIERVVRNADFEAVKLLRSPYVLYTVRYLDGRILDEHPEHLDLAERPRLRIVA